VKFAWHRHPAFLRLYGLLPHRLLNRGLSYFTAARRPAWAVQAAIVAWARLAGIDMDEFEERTYSSIDDFFLRPLRPFARPLGQGFVSPADGLLIDVGVLRADTRIRVKRQDLSVDRVVNGRSYDLDLSAYVGGAYAIVFLTPRGYHHVHMPANAVVRDVRWIPGRFFPQNPAALEHVERVYERNERAVLRCAFDDGREFLLVMVGASLIGGVHLEAMPRAEWAFERPVRVDRRYEKGEKLGHFAFGSTVVLLLPAGAAGHVELGAEVRMGETLFELRSAV
jgi:phosphatidylserine decarboxylase